MVNGINANNVINVQQVASDVSGGTDQVKKLLRYTSGEAIKEVPDTFVSNTKSGASSALLFEGLPFAFLLKRNKKLQGVFINDSMKELAQVNKKALENLLKGEGKLTTRIKDFIKTANESNKTYSEIKSAVKAQFKAEKAAAKLAKKGAETAAKETVETTAKKAAETAAKEAAETTAKEAAKTTAKEAAKTAAKSAGKLSKFTKFMKSSGAGFMLVFSGIIEAATEVIPTFKELGTEKGMKQIGKSAVKVAGDTVGFIAGQQAGVAIGTAIGTAICPGIGSAIGAGVGFVGGLLGSFVMGKVTKAIVGKSEREIAKENQENNLAQEIVNNDEKMQELKEETMTKIQEEAAINNGQLSEDSQIALDTLENLDSTNPFAA